MKRNNKLAVEAKKLRNNLKIVSHFSNSNISHIFLNVHLRFCFLGVDVFVHFDELDEALPEHTK